MKKEILNYLLNGTKGDNIFICGDVIIYDDGIYHIEMKKADVYILDDEIIIDNLQFKMHID